MKIRKIMHAKCLAFCFLTSRTEYSHPVFEPLLQAGELLGFQNVLYIYTYYIHINIFNSAFPYFLFLMHFYSSLPFLPLTHLQIFSPRWKWVEEYGDEEEGWSNSLQTLKEETVNFPSFFLHLPHIHAHTHMHSLTYT